MLQCRLPPYSAGGRYRAGCALYVPVTLCSSCGIAWHRWETTGSGSMRSSAGGRYSAGFPPATVSSIVPVTSPSTDGITVVAACAVVPVAATVSVARYSAGFPH